MKRKDGDKVQRLWDSKFSPWIYALCLLSNLTIYMFILISFPKFETKDLTVNFFRKARIHRFQYSRSNMNFTGDMLILFSRMKVKIKNSEVNFFIKVCIHEFRYFQNIVLLLWWSTLLSWELFFRSHTNHVRTSSRSESESLIPFTFSIQPWLSRKYLLNDWLVVLET